MLKISFYGLLALVDFIFIEKWLVSVTVAPLEIMSSVSMHDLVLLFLGVRFTFVLFCFIDSAVNLIQDLASARQILY